VRKTLRNAAHIALVAQGEAENAKKIAIDQRNKALELNAALEIARNEASDKADEASKCPKIRD
jgi:hypothetical protein